MSAFANLVGMAVILGACLGAGGAVALICYEKSLEFLRDLLE